MSMVSVTIHTDGGARGNPGPGGFAYVIQSEDGELVEDKGRLEHTTNNVAEYTALIRALERAAALGVRRAVVNSDSELMVKQLNGLYRVKNEDLQELHQEAKQLCRSFEKVTFQHVRREQNRRADELCNEAMDGKPATGNSAAPGSRKPAPRVTADRADAVRAEAVACLKAAAGAWARGQSETPRAEDVWEQLWSILEENGVIRPARV